MMSDLEKILEIIGIVEYEEWAILANGLTIEFDDEGNIKAWGLGE